MPSNGISENTGDENFQLRRLLSEKIKQERKNINYLKHYGEQSPPSIHRVPGVIRKSKDSAYTPSIVSIGPLHRDKERHKHLQPMEAQKLSYMHFLFHRTCRFNSTRRACEAAVLEMEPKARTFYAEEVKLHEEAESSRTEKVKFAGMLLIDGCFIIECLYRAYLKKDHSLDPIFSSVAVTYSVLNDLLLLENQIPLFVLENLFNLTVKSIPDNNDKHPRPSLIECALLFFGDMIGLEKYEIHKSWDRVSGDHFLHLLHNCYLPMTNQEQKEAEEGTEKATSCCIINLFEQRSKTEEAEKDAIEALNDFKHSAAELELSGVRFRNGSKSNLFDLRFTTAPRCLCLCRKGVFEIPSFSIYDNTEPFMRNLIAMEQSCPRVESYFTSHAFLMGKLINSAEDVKVLEEAGVVRNFLGCPEEAACLFNDICKNVNLTNFYFKRPCSLVNQYCKHRWPKFIAKLKRDYFASPWSVISVFAAFLLFALTALQTVYSILSYY